MTPRAAPGEQGMILVNVLLFVAIASGMVLLMVNREEVALDQALRGREAARAAAVARGGELSAIAALGRDQVEAPGADHRGEAWAAVAQQRVAIEGGSFELVVADAQDRFNVNQLMSGEGDAVARFAGIAEDAGLTPDQTVQAIAYIRQYGPVTDLRPLRLAGIDPAVVGQLEARVTALPGAAPINLNAARPEVLGYLFPDAGAVERLLAIRNRTGQLTLDDLVDVGVSPPYGTGFTSDTYWVRTRATIGGTTQQLATLVQRRRQRDGQPETVAVARWRNSAVPPDAPAFPDGPPER